MRQQQTRLVDLVAGLRWAIPVAIALIGAGYAVLELVYFQGDAWSDLEVIRSTLFLGLVGPVLAWITLTWAHKVAQAEAQAQEKLARRNRELAVLSEVGKAASQSLDLDEILRTTLEKMVGLTGLEAADLWLVEGDQLTLKAHYGDSVGIMSGPRHIAFDECVCGNCAQRGEAILVKNLGQQLALAHIPCRAAGFESMLSVPMQAKGRVVGVIHVASRRPNAFSARDTHILQGVGYRVATAVENVRLFEQTRRQARQLETASLVSRQVTAILDLDELLAHVVRQIRETLRFSHVNLFLVDALAGEIVLRASNGPAAASLQARGLRLKIQGPGITVQVARTGQPFLCNDVSQEPLYLYEALLPATRAELSIPLRISDVVIGVLDVHSDQPDAFKSDDVVALQILADQVAIALENAHLFREMRHQYETLRALHDISLDITARLEPGQVLDVILSHAARLLNAQGSTLVVVVPETGEIEIMAGYNFPTEYLGARMAPGQGSAGHVIATGQPLIVNDYPRWAGRAAIFDRSPYDAIISVPLRWRDQVFGALNVVDRHDRRPFVQDDVTLLSLFADLASIAIKNAELYDQVLQLSHHLEHKVQERTLELAGARAELAQKADQLQRLLASTIRIQEEERARIAQDLHDGSNQLVTGTLYQIQAAQQSLAAERTEQAVQSLEAAKHLLRDITAENRRLIVGLRPSILDTQGLVAALKWHAGQYQQRTGIACSTQVTGAPTRLAPEVETAIYRIVQESLNNVAAHAHASAVQVRLQFQPESLRLQVEDDGVGFDPTQALSATSTQLGLIGMRERAETIGGRLTIESLPGRGARISLDLPLPTPADSQSTPDGPGYLELFPN